MKTRTLVCHPKRYNVPEFWPGFGYIGTLGLGGILGGTLGALGGGGGGGGGTMMHVATSEKP